MLDSAARDLLARDLPGCEGAAFDARGRSYVTLIGTKRIVRADPNGVVGTPREDPIG
jgi:hypothetical protein